MVACILPSAYYAYVCFDFIKYILLDNWHFKKSQFLPSVIELTYISLKGNVNAVGLFVCLSIIAFSLISFLGIELYSISINITQIEFEKYRRLKWKRFEEEDDTKVCNFYDNGIINNWKEFLHPKKPKDQEPLEYNEKPVNVAKEKMLEEKVKIELVKQRKKFVFTDLFA